MRTTVFHSLLASAVFGGLAPAQIEMPKPLSGVYSVDPKGTGKRVFKDLASAARYISLAGVAGDFRLEVHPGKYQGGLNFFPVSGLEDGAKLLIKAVGEGEVRLEHDAVLIRLNDGVKDIVFDGLVFGESGSDPTILAGSKCTDIEIRNCRFTKQTGSRRVIEIRGRNGSRRWHIHHNRFELGSRIQNGIYTQATYEVDIHDNDFLCDGCREPISFWNANKSQSRVHRNVFRGSVNYCAMRLDVSGHDVDVYENLFLLELTGNRDAVIRSQGLGNRAYNKIRHNVFVLPGHGTVVRTRGPIALNHNLYAIADGSVGAIDNTVYETLKEWQDSLGGMVQDEQGDQASAVALPKFFSQHARLIGLIHQFNPEEKADPMTPKEEVRFLIPVLRDDDPVAVRLALHRLIHHGRRAAAAVPALGRLCSHSHAAVRATAARALARIRIGTEIVIPELFKLLDDDDELVLLAAIETLGKFEHLAAEAAPRLQSLENHESAAVKAAAAAARRAVLGKQEAARNTSSGSRSEPGPYRAVVAAPSGPPLSSITNNAVMGVRTP